MRHWIDKVTSQPTTVSVVRLFGKHPASSTRYDTRSARSHPADPGGPRVRRRHRADAGTRHRRQLDDFQRAARRAAAAAAVRRPGALVVLWESNHQLGQEQEDVSGATYLDWRARSKTFSSIGAYRYRGFTLTGAGSATGAAERIASVDVSPALFTVLGVSASRAAPSHAEEERPGHERLAVLSHGAWLRRFGGVATSSVRRCFSTACRTRSSA